MGGAGGVLDDAVGVVAREARRHQGEEHRLAEDQAVRPVEVLQHALGVDGEALHHRSHLDQQVVGEQGRVGQDDPLHRGVGDVALVPQGDVLEAGAEVAAQDPGQAGQAFARDRVALVGHGRAALLPGPERFRRLAHLGALEVADLGGELLDRRAHRRARPQVLGVAVAGHDLGGRHRLQAEGLAHLALHDGVDVGVRADRAGQLADGDAVPCPLEALAVAVGLQRPVGQLDAERGRLGVHAVGAAGHRDVPELDGPGLQCVDQIAAGDDQQVGGLGEGGAEGGVDHVARRQAVVHPVTGGGTDCRLDHVDEGGHVVVGGALALVDRGHEGGVDGGARSRTALASSGGTTPRLDHPSVARTSISSHRASLASSVKRAAIFGSE